MNHAIELGYLRIEVGDPTALTPFFTDVIGLAPGDATPDGDLTWSDDEAVQRLIVGEGPRNDLAALGFDALDAAAFDATLTRIAAAGYDTTDGDAGQCRARRVDRLVTVEAPW